MRLRSARLLRLTVSTLSQCGQIVLKLGLSRKISLLLFFHRVAVELSSEQGQPDHVECLDPFGSDSLSISLCCFLQIFFQTCSINIGFRVGDIFAEF